MVSVYLRAFFQVQHIAAFGVLKKKTGRNGRDLVPEAGQAAEDAGKVTDDQGQHTDHRQRDEE